jgi:hypothetical protein
LLDPGRFLARLWGHRGALRIAAARRIVVINLVRGEHRRRVEATLARGARRR